jgi:hypothetical protein
MRYRVRFCLIEIGFLRHWVSIDKLKLVVETTKSIGDTNFG